MRAERWLEIAGFATWLVSGIPGLLRMGQGLDGSWLGAWIAAYGAFGLAFGLACRHPWGRDRRGQVVLLAVQAVAALALVASSDDMLPAALLVVVAGQLMGVLAPRGAALWVAGQSLLLVAIGAWLAGLVTAAAIGVAFAGFQLFALATSSLAISERRGRDTLARANAELQAAHALLAENSRVAERLRISRDLHDTLGHHLTALSLQLDVASHLAAGAAADHVRQAHAIARLLLADVRGVVSALRDAGPIDLREALRSLADARPSPLAVHLDLPPALPVDDPERAHALLRCVQEVITNTERHAHAANLWIRLERRADGVALSARDDGRGTPALVPGHGLTGMRERFAALAGSIEFESRPDAGFHVRGFLPGAPAVP